MVSAAPRVFYLVTEDWYFCSHRLNLARAARAAGYDITVVTRVQEHGDVIRREGFRLVPVDFARNASSPWRDLRTLCAILRIYRAEKPDLVHHVALKPVLLGSLAATAAGLPRVINALTGLGHVFTSRGLGTKLLRQPVRITLGWLLCRANSWVILQNWDDAQMLTREGMVCPERVSIIRGSGVDTRRFSPSPEPPGPPVVVLAARMLADKGVREFVEAARLLHGQAVEARFVLIGDRDPQNPSALQAETLDEWQRSGVVEWWGTHEDMAEVFRGCHVVCLPSYREGLPKVLIEAAACGRAIVTTDVPGCREVVRNGVNGYLVPARDGRRLSQALRSLIEAADLRVRMGEQGREIAVSEFADERVIRETLALYARVLASAQVPAA